MGKKLLKKKPQPKKSTKGPKSNYRFFEKLPEAGYCYHHIKWNDVERLSGDSLENFLVKEVGVDLRDHPEAETYDQILVGICRFLDENPNKYDTLFLY